MAGKSRNTLIPLYLKVKDALLRRIAAGEWRVGARIPPERKLVETCGASLITLKRALRELEEEGYLLRKQGKGTFVVKGMESAPDVGIVSSYGSKTGISFGVMNPSREDVLLFELLRNEFQLSHPDISLGVKTIFPAPQTSDDPYLSLLAGGDVPTVGEFFLHADYASIDGLVPLEGLPGFNEIHAGIDSLPPHLTGNSMNIPHVHALPYMRTVRAPVANSLALEQAGLTLSEAPFDWQSLRHWSEKLGVSSKQRAEGHFGVFSEPPSGWHGVIGYFPYIWSERKAPPENSMEDFCSATLGSGRADWLELLSELHRIGNPCPLGGSCVPLFAAGKIGLLLSGSQRHLALPEIIGGELLSPVALPFPGPGRSVIGDFSLGVFAAGAKREDERLAAWEWIKFLMRPECQNLISRNRDCLPVMAEAMTHWRKRQTRYLNFDALLSSACLQYDFPGVRRALSLLGRTLKRTLFGSGDPQKELSMLRENLLVLREGFSG